MARPVSVELDEFIACVEDNHIRAHLVRAFARYLTGPHVSKPMGWVPLNQQAMVTAQVTAEHVEAARVAPPVRSLDFDDLPDPLDVQRVASSPPMSRVPAGVHWNPEVKNFFYDDRRGSCGQSFYYTWVGHTHLFPHIEGKYDVLTPRGEVEPQRVPDRRETLVGVDADVDGLFASEEPVADPLPVPVTGPWHQCTGDGADPDYWRKAENGIWHYRFNRFSADADVWTPMRFTSDGRWTPTGPGLLGGRIRWRDNDQPWRAYERPQTGANHANWRRGCDGSWYFIRGTMCDRFEWQASGEWRCTATSLLTYFVTFVDQQSTA